MKNKRIQYIDQICLAIKNILIDRTYYEISHIHISLEWDKGEEPYLSWEFHGENKDTVTIPESEDK